MKSVRSRLVKNVVNTESSGVELSALRPGVLVQGRLLPFLETTCPVASTAPDLGPPGSCHPDRQGEESQHRCFPSVLRDFRLYLSEATFSLGPLSHHSCSEHSAVARHRKLLNSPVTGRRFGKSQNVHRMKYGGSIALLIIKTKPEKNKKKQTKKNLGSIYVYCSIKM